MRTPDDLVDVDDPGIDVLRALAQRPDANENVILPVDATLRGPALERLQVTTRSLLGAVVYETGGLLVDHARLRVFGSSAARSFWDANDAVSQAEHSEHSVLFIGDDVFGGVFAFNGGRFGQDDLGQVFHLPADATRWSSTEVGYADFIAWCLTGDLALIDAHLREDKFAGVEKGTAIDKVYSFYPFLWTEEGRSGAGTMRLVDANENLRLRIEMLGYKTVLSLSPDAYDAARLADQTLGFHLRVRKRLVAVRPAA
ncbi:hypothetical protein RHAL1_02850 [Beijerinckiaceae bacterium RH AL1]|nr:DUF2625 family protein [Beijerinckiaceae bacterium]VVB47515.1 hypothetical protein RHCH11_RHCH11_02790 [Beijerinckiaceae bacterium RH CH11]VVB47596.1 hypothetical protein RHAL8_02786 [Beijerinckiaceae bacterium RH AL8]VVC55927.1 hypothetical protein RHAL1_02850 [Beijerinckiaceae bacterium RH AL1]